MERPIKIIQSWRVTLKDGKWNSIPVVRSRPAFGKMKQVSRNVWFDYIKNGWLTVNNDLRRWLDENGHENI